MLPDCHLADKRIPVSLNDIKQRIQLQYLLKDPTQSKIIEIPHDRSHPDSHLKGNVDDLTQIAKENNCRTRHISQCKDQHKNTEAVINKLQCIKTRRIAHKGIDHQQDHNKKGMYKHC